MQVVGLHFLLYLIKFLMNFSEIFIFSKNFCFEEFFGIYFYHIWFLMPKIWTNQIKFKFCPVFFSHHVCLQLPFYCPDDLSSDNGFYPSTAGSMRCSDCELYPNIPDCGKWNKYVRLSESEILYRNFIVSLRPIIHFYSV